VKSDWPGNAAVWGPGIEVPPRVGEPSGLPREREALPYHKKPAVIDRATEPEADALHSALAKGILLAGGEIQTEPPGRKRNHFQRRERTGRGECPNQHPNLKSVCGKLWST
jgi:hypothetical protein